MKAREWLKVVGGIVRGIVIATAIAGVFAYVVEWWRLHRDTEPQPWAWALVVVSFGVSLLVHVVDAVVKSVRHARQTRHARKLELAHDSEIVIARSRRAAAVAPAHPRTCTDGGSVGRSGERAG